MTSFLCVTILSIVHGVGIAHTSNEPPLRLTTNVLETSPCESTKSGLLDMYFVALDAGLHEALDGKTPSVAIKFAATDAGSFALQQWKLLSRLDAANRTALATQFPDVLCWLLTQREPLDTLLTAGDIEGNRWNEATRLLCTIVEKDPSAREGLLLRLAVATALVFATPVNAMSGGEIDAISRYEAYKTWNEEGVLFPSFRELTAWELRYVVGSWSTNEDLVWARANIKPELKQRDKIGDGAHMLGYNLVNKNGVSVQAGAKFYDDKPMTLPIMLEYGGVCGAISRFGTSMSQAFGVPAMPIAQPGHCAFIWQKEPHAWTINNDISGWAESGCHGGIHMTWGQPAWFMPLMQQAQSSRANYAAAESLRVCATFAPQSARAAILAEACAKCPQDYAAWQERFTALKADEKSAASTQWKDAMKQAAAGFAKHPMAFGALLAIAEPALLDAKSTPAARRSFAIKSAHTLAVMANGGADAGLVSFALRNMLAVEAESIAPESKKIARALVMGNEEKEGTINKALAIKIIDMTIAASNELDLAPTGPAHDAWAASLHRLINGIGWQPALREDGLRRVQNLITALMNSKREGDARWFADRIVESAKATKDAAFEAKAVALRTSLG